MVSKENFRRIDLKRKYHGGGKGGNKRNFKKFRPSMPKFVKNNPENFIAKEIKEKADVYEFIDSDDPADELGMGVEISDLPFLCNDDTQKQLHSLEQESVRPMFADEESYDPIRVRDALAELRYRSFRPLQQETIKRILLGKSTLFISPTGSGKSLCYQIPAMLYWRFKKYITIVVSPLISLMEDQIKNFPSELKAVSLNSGNTKVQRQQAVDLLARGEAQVAFMSPEAIVSGILSVDDLRKLPPVGFVCIDEAHCLCEWSQNFRPAYLQFFNILNKKLNIKTYLGLTATSTRSTSIAIAKHIGIDISDNGIVGVAQIPENLILSVSSSSNKDLAIVNLLKSSTFRILSSIIIYCSRREDTEKVASTIRASMQRYSTIIEAPTRLKRTDELSDELNESDEIRETIRLTWHAEAYHGGLSIDKRKQIQKQFIKGEIRVVVATIAFGMGINKSNVKAIIHYDMPASFESYVQEIGRAGRDGKPAQCHMILHNDQTDKYWQQRNIYANVAEYKDLQKLVNYMFPKCNCESKADQEMIEDIRKKNEDEPHYLNDDVNPFDDEDLMGKITVSVEKSNIDHKIDNQNQGRKSSVKKHRICCGHEVSFPIEEATQELNVTSESILTLMCKIQKAYPQLDIQFNNPIQWQGKLVCHNGPNQLKTLLDSNQITPVQLRCALRSERKKLAPQDQSDNINKLSFNLIDLANSSGLPSNEVRRLLKRTEFNLDDKTGRFRRSQIKICYSGLAFYINCKTDLNSDEWREINSYLKSYTNNYIVKEREKINRVYNVFRTHCLEIEQMDNKINRLKTSYNLKCTLNKYFQSEDISDQSSPVKSQFNIKHITTIDANNTIEEELVRKRIKSFISAHGTSHTSRAITRVLQGISTPNYPAEIWGTNRNWWRTIINMDFEKLDEICKQELYYAKPRDKQNKNVNLNLVDSEA